MQLLPSTDGGRQSHLCEMVFLTALSISAYVSSNPSGWKIGSANRLVSNQKNATNKQQVINNKTAAKYNHLRAPIAEYPDHSHHGTCKGVSRTPNAQASSERRSLTPSKDGLPPGWHDDSICAPDENNGVCTGPYKPPCALHGDRLLFLACLPLFMMSLPAHQIS